jgi:hypothetical protein
MVTEIFSRHARQLHTSLKTSTREVVSREIDDLGKACDANTN